MPTALENCNCQGIPMQNYLVSLGLALKIPRQVTGPLYGVGLIS